MGLEQNNEQHYREVVDKYGDPVADYQMSTRDYVLRPSPAFGAGGITITLPPVAEAKGRIYTIISRGATAGNTVTVADMDDSECWVGDIVMDGPCDRLCLYSDGLAWWPFFEGGWPGMATTAPPGATTTPPTTGA